VPGLDEVLGGGLPEFSFNVIAGRPGSGKTTLAHQMMFALATPERPGLYFTVLGEPPLKMLRYQQQFDFFDDKRVAGSIRFVHLAEEAAAGDLGKVLVRIAAEVEAHGPGMVFVDSFRSVAVAGASGSNSFLSLQHFVQQLCVLMTSWQATTLLLGEYFEETDADPVFTIADGIFWLRQSVQRNSVVRKMEIVKMRGQPTLPGLHAFRISRAGISVVPPTPVYDSVSAKGPDQAARVNMGTPRLDDMMHGGLPRGYSLLIAGPSGSGKSIMASAFLLEGAKQGENCVIADFEQRPNRTRSPAIAELIQSGRIGVVDTRAVDLSVNEVASLLMTEIRRLKATRVVIDSLSRFELALAPTFREDFRESMVLMLSALSNTGVTVVITSELEDRYTDLRFSPNGTAFLTDAIIVQRYIELDSQLQRVLAVVKLRASAHSSDLRLFRIDDSGILIGDPLVEHEGLLGGRPTRNRPPSDAQDNRDD
jgi:circadian clock protein KaiC